MKVAIIGATGMLGKPVATQLVNSGFRVTALVRNKSKAAAQLHPSINLVAGDLKDSTSLQQFLKGQDAVYLNLNLTPEEKQNDFHAETDGLKNIIAAAKQENVKRIAFISSIVMNYQGMNGFHWWVFDVKKEAVQLIKNSGIPYTIFYPSAFMENFEGNYRQGNNMMLAGTSKHKMYFISADDYGKQVAKSFTILQHENKEYNVQGPEAYTATEAVDIYVRNYTKSKLSIKKAPLGLLKFFGLFSSKFNYASHIIDALNNYPEKFISEDTWRDLGKPSTTIADYAKLKSSN